MSQHSLRIAVYSLVISTAIGAISAVIGIASGWYTYKSYVIAEVSANAAEKSPAAESAQQEQTKLLKELLQVQRDENIDLRRRIESLEKVVPKRTARHSAP